MGLDERGYIVVRTLRDYIDHGLVITAHCSRYWPICTHWKRLNLNMLVQRFGWDFAVRENHDLLAGMLICEKCGHRGATFTISALDTPTIGGALHVMKGTDTPSPRPIHLKRRRRSRKQPR